MILGLTNERKGLITVGGVFERGKVLLCNPRLLVDKTYNNNNNNK